MVNYIDPKKWVILQYRPGTGGKFLCAALLTIERIAHWDSRVEHSDITFQDWVNEQWTHTNDFKWIAHEPLHQWDIRFFSRTWPRGENLSLEDFQTQMNASSDYFKEVWKSDKLVLDFLNKSHVPQWWRDSHISRLDARPGCEIHKKLLLSKIYPYDASTKVGMFMMDHPLPENPSPNARVYKNPYEFGPFESQDDWYKHIWSTDFRLNFSMPKSDILLDDLLNFGYVNQFVKATAKKLNSTYNQPNLEYLWQHWIKKHENILKSIDTQV
jgi:hypothetical protein